MDYIEGLAKQASQLTMYDVKSYYNQAKNMVLNVSETEAKVREATNDDPWGASTTLMQEIADGTHNFTQFNEIMPTIYSRFMEKEAREWRQIYKALTLLEYLVKNGSERVVDDARAHISTIKMLRSFHYIDEKGKDQGINIRNRAQEIAALLGDVEKIRTERRKAKANRTKYGGQGGGGGMSFITAGGSKYGGFGSEDLAGGGGGGGSSDWRNNYDRDDDYRGSRRPYDNRGGAGGGAAEYDEYEGADDFDDQPPRRTGSSSHNRGDSRPAVPPKSAAAPKPVAKAAEKQKEVNLFDLDDDEPLAAAAPSAAQLKPVDLTGGDDDFDDFQSGPNTQVPTPTASAPKPAPATSNNANLFDLLNSSSPPMASQPRSPMNQSMSSNAMPAMQAKPPSYSQGMQQPVMTSRPSYTSTASTTATPAVTSPKPTSGSTFDDLWNTSLTSAGGTAKPAQGTNTGKTIKDLEKQKAMDKLWGPTSPGLNTGANATGTFGGMGSNGAKSTPPAKPSSTFDDLLG